MLLVAIQLFRTGSGGRNSRIPRRGIDDNGLSFYESLQHLAAAVHPKPGTEWFSIDTSKLKMLRVVKDERPDKEGHYLLVPQDGQQMTEWQEMWDILDSQNPRYEHPLAQDVLQARAGMPRGRFS